MAVENWLAVLVSAIASMILGWLWYGPLFGKVWINMMGFTKKDMDAAKKKGMAKSYLLMFISALVTASVISILVGMTGTSDAIGGMILGFWVWLGFVATITLSSVLWEGKKFSLWFLNNAYNLINLLIIGAILGFWH